MKNIKNKEKQKKKNIQSKKKMTFVVGVVNLVKIVGTFSVWFEYCEEKSRKNELKRQKTGKELLVEIELS